MFQASDVPVQAGVTGTAGGLRIGAEVQGRTGLCGAEVRLGTVSEHRLALWRAPFEIRSGRLHRALHLEAVLLPFPLFRGRGLTDALEFILAVRQRCQAFLLGVRGGDRLAAAPRRDGHAFVTLEVLVVFLHVQDGRSSSCPVRSVDLTQIACFQSQSDEKPVVVIARARTVPLAAASPRVLQQRACHAGEGEAAVVLKGWKAFVSEREGGLPSLDAGAAHRVVVGALADLCGLGVEEAVVQDKGGSTCESGRENRMLSINTAMATAPIKTLCCHLPVYRTEL